MSILPVIAKMFENFRKQQTLFMVEFISKNHCGSRKGYSAQYCLLAMLEKWKQAFNSAQAFGALLTGLSKAFDCLPHELLIPKLSVSGFSL